MHGDFLWASVSGRNSDPFAEISVDPIYGDLFGGREVPPNLFVEGGSTSTPTSRSLLHGPFQCAACKVSL